MSASEPEYFPCSEFPSATQFLTIMQEPSLYARRRQSGTEFRLLQCPTFGQPSSIRITRTSTGAELRAVRLSLRKFQDLGVIQFDCTHKLDDTQWDHFLALLNEASFSEMPEKDRIAGLDGSTWIFEGRSHGWYHLIHRWSPTSETSSRNLEAFLACCNYLFHLSQFSIPPS